MSRMILFCVTCSVSVVRFWILRATPLRWSFRTISRLCRTSSSLCRRCLLKSVSTEIPVSTCPVVSVPCCPDSRKLHRKFRRRDEYALVPFFRFYDTVHTFLDGSIRRVIERCQKAADNGDGIEQQDVDVLKLLYLIRYIDDIPSNLDNIVILMADDIRVDKIIMREVCSWLP